MNKNFKQQKGFTLIELMIVVAIIGILASLAIPSLHKYILKSKRSEAYLALGIVYDAEMAYKAEKNFFTTSIHELGIQMNGAPSYSNLNCIEGSLYACGKYFVVWGGAGKRE